MIEPAKRRGMPDVPVFRFVMIRIQLPVVEFFAAVSAKIVILAIAGDSDHKALHDGVWVDALSPIISTHRTDHKPFRKSVFLCSPKADEFFIPCYTAPLRDIPHKITAVRRSSLDECL